jgi:hypothetical protein
MRRIMTKIVLRMLQRVLSQALGRWVDAVEELTAARAEEERLKEVKRRIVVRIMQRGAARCANKALDRWIENVADLKAMSVKGSKVLMRWKLKVPSKSSVCSLMFCSVDEGVSRGD